MAKKVYFDNLRTLGHAAISGSYAPVGAALTVTPRIICITNNTDGDMIFSVDSSNAVGNLFLAKGSFKLFDLTSNMNPHYDDTFEMAVGTYMYVKEVTAPTLGSVYVEYIYG